MSVVTLNNNQIATIVNEAVAQISGASSIDDLDLRGIVDRGGDESIIGSRDQFTKALINVITKKWYLDTEYRSDYSNPFFVDEAQFGAITETISITVPDAQPALNWTDIESGVTQLGSYTIYLPTVDVNVYGKSSSWQIPVGIQEEQLATAFDSENDLREFVSHIFLCIDNALVIHMEALDSANRNNFIAEKIHYAGTVGATGVHVVNLVEEYVKSTGSEATGMTATAYLNDKDALADGAKVIMSYSKYISKLTKTYNIGGKLRHCPKSRQVLQLLDSFDKQMTYHMRSATFHEDLVSIPGFDTVAWWQSEDAKDSIDVDIDVSGVKTEVHQSGIVGLLCDRWGIIRTTVNHRTAAKLFEPEHLTQYYYQFTDRYFNNLSMNAVVFIVADVNPS